MPAKHSAGPQIRNESTAQALSSGCSLPSYGADTLRAHQPQSRGQRAGRKRWGKVIWELAGLWRFRRHLEDQGESMFCRSNSLDSILELRESEVCLEMWSSLVQERKLCLGCSVGVQPQGLSCHVRSFEFHLVSNGTLPNRYVFYNLGFTPKFLDFFLILKKI